MEAAAPQTFRAGAEPGQGHQPVCTFFYTLVSSELTQDHLLWLGSCPPSLRSGVVQALLSNRTCGHCPFLALLPCTTLGIRGSSVYEWSSQCWSRWLQHQHGRCLVSAAQDQEDGKHVEGREGKLQALLLQRQAALHSWTLQEVTAGEQSTRLKGLISVPTHPQPSGMDLQHCLLNGEGGLEPGCDRAAMGLVEPNHHSLRSVLSLWRSSDK